MGIQSFDEFAPPSSAHSTFPGFVGAFGPEPASTSQRETVRWLVYALEKCLAIGDEYRSKIFPQTDHLLSRCKNSMMKVALDTHCLYVTRAGTARYVRGLLSGFSELGSANLRIDRLAWEVENFGYRQPMRSLKTAFRELVWAPLLAPLRLSALNPNILHCTAPSLPMSHPARVREVVTQHDLAVLRQPKWFRRWQAAHGRRHLELLRRAAKIICVSQFTADEAVQLLNLRAKQLEVVHHGIEIETPTSDTLSLQLPESFFLFVGSLEPGKNLALLRQRYLVAQSQGVVLPPLLIVGSRWQGAGTEGVPPESWRYLGHPTDSILTDLCRRARALLFPSLYEGFGFPVLEAMAQGGPVICGRVASLPEIGGEAAIYTELDAVPFLHEMKRVLLVVHPLLMRIWTGRWLADFSLASLLAASAMLAGFANTYSTLLNSLGAIRPQAIFPVVMIAPVVILSAVLAHRMGPPGVVLAACLCTIPSCFAS